MSVYDGLLRRTSRVTPVREGKVSLRPSGSGAYVDIGFCRIESDEPAAITVKHALGGRRVFGYNDRLEVSWLQTSTSEMAALATLQDGEHDVKLTRTDECGSAEERVYEGYYMQLLPGLQQGKIKIIFEKMLSVAQMEARMVVV